MNENELIKLGTDVIEKFDFSTAEVRAKVNSFILAKKQLDKQEEELKTKLTEYMVQNDIKEKVILDNYNVKLIERKELTEKFDTERFANEHPELYKQYCYYTSTSESVSIRKNSKKDMELLGKK